jgi:cation diffusion facilitator family transporter
MLRSPMIQINTNSSKAAEGQYHMVQTGTTLPGGHNHGNGFWGLLGRIFHLHDHGNLTEARVLDPALGTTLGIRTVWLALAALGTTTLLQLGVVWLSGSVALFADTVHNLGDTLNSIPLLLALYLARRAATRRYTYGFGRAEDLAGVVIVLSIALSAAIIFWESFNRLLNPQPLHQIGWVAVAALIGFLGNEAVAQLQIRVGRRINSEALIADGVHARIDGFTSLAVLLPVLGSLFGLTWLDPLVGLLIGISILFITRDAFVRIWQRVMDAIDPAYSDRIEQLATEVSGVDQVTTIRARWIGHVLDCVIEIRVADTLLHVESQAIITRVRSHIISHLGVAAQVVVALAPATSAAYDPLGAEALAILPPRYRTGAAVSAAPMGAAALQYNQTGQVAWDDMWTGFCELALAGGAPHRGLLLEPIDPLTIAGRETDYQCVLAELQRGLQLVTGRSVVTNASPGWIGMVCDNEQMALWLLRAIVVENISVRREVATLWFPAGPDFRLEREIKSIITVVAKTTHYWTEHAQALVVAS